jgi:hypothetical protein
MPCSALLAPPMERARSGPAAHSSPSGSRAPFCACTRVLYHHSARAVEGLTAGVLGRGKRGAVRGGNGLRGGGLSGCLTAVFARCVVPHSRGGLTRFERGLSGAGHRLG